jgi:hypothetical protein
MIGLGTIINSVGIVFGGITGLLFMRKDGSLFGVLPEGSFFLDEPEKNPLSEDVMARILDAPLG